MMEYGKHRSFEGEEYDRENNLFYLSIYPKSRKIMSGKKETSYDTSKVVNVVIHDVKKQTSKPLFEETSGHEVLTHLLFETSYDEKLKEITFNRYSSKVQNNRRIEKRPLLDRLLVCQEDLDSGLKKLWAFDKDGSNQRLLVSLPKEAEWRLDVYNQSSRTFIRDADNPEIRDYDW